jgi:hypothetical protein
MQSQFLSLLLAGLILGTATAPALSANPPRLPRPTAPEQSTWRTVLRHAVGNWHCPEIVEMLWAVANGSEMGPGDGWFHAGQSRYGWDWLAARYDGRKNGHITREEFQGPAELFERLDRDGDGTLTADDFDWSDRSPFVRQMGMTARWFRCLDTNSNGRISRAEWEAFFARAAKGKDHLTREDLRVALNPPLPSKGSGDEPSPLVLLRGLLNGELGSLWEGPAINQQAPDFVLRTQDGERQIRLSEFRGKKPVVLVFGSFT